MSETEQTTSPINGEPAEETSAQAEGTNAEAGAPAEATEPSVEQRLADALGEAARMRDQFLRTAADFDNFRKRTRKEVDDAQRRGKEGAVKELLPVFDNFERALNHAAGSADGSAVAEGLRIVLKQFLD